VVRSGHLNADLRDDQLLARAVIQAVRRRREAAGLGWTRLATRAAAADGDGNDAEEEAGAGRDGDGGGATTARRGRVGQHGRNAVPAAAQPHQLVGRAWQGRRRPATASPARAGRTVRVDGWPVSRQCTTRNALGASGRRHAFSVRKNARPCHPPADGRAVVRPAAAAIKPAIKPTRRASTGARDADQGSLNGSTL
jgi:hypothetical protein